MVAFNVVLGEQPYNPRKQKNTHVGTKLFDKARNLLTDQLCAQSCRVTQLYTVGYSLRNMSTGPTCLSTCCTQDLMCAVRNLPGAKCASYSMSCRAEPSGIWALSRRGFFYHTTNINTFKSLVTRVIRVSIACLNGK